MLQTRRSPLRPLSVGLVLLYCSVYLTAAQPSRTCINTAQAASRQSAAAKTQIYDNLKDETVLTGVCKLDKTCCSKEAENMFKKATAGNYREKVQLALVDSLMPCHNHTVLGEIVDFIRASKDNLVSVMKRQFLIYFDPYVNIFDEFYEYLESTVWSGDTCQIKERFTKVSFEMFLAAYVVTSQSQGLNSDLPDTPAFRSCFFDYFLEQRGDAIYNKLNGFLRAYNLTMRYIRSLKLLDDVIEDLVDLTLTPQCQDAIMKMTHCSQCAGYNGELLPCRGLCQNSLRGCLVDLIDMVEPVREFTAAIVNLNKVLNNTYNPWDQITLLNSYFFQTVSHTREHIAEINEELFLRCDALGHRNTRSVADKKRSAPSFPDAPQESVKILDRERRVVSTRAAPTPPFAAMNYSSHCVSETVSIFTSLPEKLCGEERIGKSNSACWTGISFGSYGREVLAPNRAAQKDNPEMVVCQRKSRVDVQVAKLRFMTHELNVLTGAQECSDDDEDCADTVPEVCTYYEFPDSYDVTEEEIGSGSGSGDDGVEFVTTSEEESAACASINSVPNVVVTPIVSGGPTNAVSGGEDVSTDSGAMKMSSSASTLLTLFLVLVSLAATTSSCKSYL